MGRPVWCRFCGHPALAAAGVLPLACEKCDGENHWATQPPNRYMMHKKHQKRPRVPFDLTFNDKRLLRSLRIAAPES